jgi:hypothetical protein
MDGSTEAHQKEWPRRANSFLNFFSFQTCIHQPKEGTIDWNQQKYFTVHIPPCHEQKLHWANLHADPSYTWQSQGNSYIEAMTYIESNMEPEGVCLSRFVDVSDCWDAPDGHIMQQKLHSHQQRFEHRALAAVQGMLFAVGLNWCGCIFVHHLVCSHLYGEFVQRQISIWRQILEADLKRRLVWSSWGWIVVQNIYYNMYGVHWPDTIGWYPVIG